MFIFPLEIRSCIYLWLDDLDLALEDPEVFWALAPQYFRHLTLGQYIAQDKKLTLSTRLAQRYPLSGNFVERLTIIADERSQPLISEWLEKFPPNRKLKHFILVDDFDVRESPFTDLLLNLVSTSPELTRLSFSDYQPSPEVIAACGNNLTRLDIGNLDPLNVYQHFSLPSRLEVFSFTPWAVNLFLGAPPTSLEVVIIRAGEFTEFYDPAICCSFLANCPSLRRLAVDDRFPSENIPILLGNLSPQIEDVCFRFFSVADELEDVRSLGEVLHTNPCLFKFLSIIVPFFLRPHEELDNLPSSPRGSEEARAVITPRIIATLDENVEDIKRMLNLRGCYLQVEGEEVAVKGELGTGLLKNWVNLIDYDEFDRVDYFAYD